VVRQLIQHRHRLRNRKARQTAAPDVREPLTAEADAIKADTTALRQGMQCPADALAVPAQSR
jgi:hypothetical protein